MTSVEMQLNSTIKVTGGTTQILMQTLSCWHDQLEIYNSTDHWGNCMHSTQIFVQTLSFWHDQYESTTQQHH